MLIYLGARMRDPQTNAVFVVIDTGHLGETPVYVLADPKLPYSVVVKTAAEFDAIEVIEPPHYDVSRLNPTTWAVHYPAAGRGSVSHVLAQVDSLIAARRMAVTQNLLRAALL